VALPCIAEKKYKMLENLSNIGTKETRTINIVTIVTFEALQLESLICKDSKEKPKFTALKLLKIKIRETSDVDRKFMINFDETELSQY
jgi:hypothetical protein